MLIQLNDQTALRVTGYPPSPGYYDKTCIMPAIVSFEIGASCGAKGTYGIHLSPDQARELAEVLIEESAKATGGAS